MRGLPAEDEVTTLRRELAVVKDELALLRKHVLTSTAPAASSTSATNGRYPRAPRPTMHDLEDWVVNFIQGTLERRASNTRRWCAQWYKHPEVISRFWVLYHSYLEIELKGSAVQYSTWYVDHLDRHLEAITSADGPFAACSTERHTPHRGLVVARNENAEIDWGKRPALTNYLPSTAPRSAEVNR